MVARALLGGREMGLICEVQSLRKKKVSVKTAKCVFVWSRSSVCFTNLREGEHWADAAIRA